MKKLKNYLNYLRFFSAGQRKMYLLMLFVGTLGALIEAAGLSIFIPLLLDGEMPAMGAMGKVKASIESNLGFTLDQGTVLGMMLAVFTIRGVLKFLDIHLKGKAATYFVHRVQTLFIAFLNDMKFSEFQKRNRGEVTAIFTTHMVSARLAFISTANQLLWMFSVVSFGLIAFLVNFQMIIIAISVGLCYFGIQRVFSKRVGLNSRAAVAENAKVSNTLLQTLGSLKYLKTTNSFRPLNAHLGGMIASLRNSYRKVFFYQGIIAGLQQPVSIGIFVLLVYWSTRYQNLKISVVIANMAIIQRMVQAAMNLITEFTTFAEHRPAIDQMLAEKSKMTEHSDNLSGTKEVQFSKAIHFDKVKLSFGDKEVLKGVRLSIRANNMVGFTGGSGSGKSTILDLVTGVHQATSGLITIDGIPMKEIKLRDWQSMVGIVSQDIPIFNDTILNNITLWQTPKETSQEKIDEFEKDAWDALTLALADDFVRTLPHGIHTLIGEKGVALSGGQRQRIAIARELYKKPKILILDEATSALDSQTERAIQETLEALKGHATIILVAHRLSTLQLCDQLYVLEQGLVVESGPFEVLFSDVNSRFRSLWESASLAPKGPSTRIKPKEDEWKLWSEFQGEKALIPIANISETGLAIVPDSRTENLANGADIEGNLEHKLFHGPVTLKIVHRFGGIIGCQFSDISPEIKNALMEYIRENSQAGQDNV